MKVLSKALINQTVGDSEDQVTESTTMYGFILIWAAEERLRWVS